MPSTRTPPIVFAGRIGGLSAVLLIAGPALAHLGWAPPLVGLNITSFAGAVSALACGLAAYAWARGVRPTRAGSVGLVSAVITMLVTFNFALSQLDYPPINDVTTNPAHPVAFENAEVPPYPAANAAIQAEHYPWLVGPEIDAPASEVAKRIERIAADLGWRITMHGERHLEAVATTPVYRFEDDVAIDLHTTTSSTTIVQVRSRSRVGKGDVGVNAKRIRRFLEALL